MTERSLTDQLSEDLKTAMRAGNTTSRDAIRFILSGLKTAQIDQRGPLSRDQEIRFLNQQAKRLTEAIEQFSAAGRTDLADKEAAQLAVLQQYLPAALSDDELREMVKSVIAETGATGPRDMGKVMPKLIEQAGGRADGARISAAVREQLK
ncbi:MAG TPA: GatB/YqeY domain-containing protein [Thermomicrobiales bacterium]|nr:GatB/YqeY domain-containing protein [Thermomicrobiales bacterium]